VKLGKKLLAGFDRTNDALTFFAAILLVFATAAVVAGVITRAIGQPVGWIVEVCSFILIYVCFLAAAWVLRKDGHVGIDFVVDRLRPRIRSMFYAGTSIVCGLISLTITYYGAKTTLAFYHSGQFVVSVLEPPKWVFLIIIPVGSLLLAIQCFLRADKYLRKGEAPVFKPDEAREI